LFQSVTSIQEQTLTFVPKVLAIVLLLILLMPWMLRTLVEFAAGMIGRMPQMVQ
jgi:flagellar biosynthesis protein FliQ